MWQAYYRRQFLKLFFLLIRLMRESFGVDQITAARIAYQAALAAIDFRRHKGRENQERILKKLIKFYRIIFSHSLEPFDYKKAAEFELRWWLIDRYPESYEISRKKALGLAMAAVYNVDTSTLDEYADQRAKAMVLQDEAKNLKNKEADWDKIGSLLKTSYRSLYRAIQ